MFKVLVHFTNLSGLCQHHQYAWYPLEVQLVAIATHQEMICPSLSVPQYRSFRIFGFHSLYRSEPEADHRDIASVGEKRQCQFKVGEIDCKCIRAIITFTPDNLIAPPSGQLGAGFLSGISISASLGTDRM